MRPVVQLEPTGCGIASVAAIAHITYHRARSIANSLGIFAGDELLWSDTAYVRRLLKAVGCSAGRSEIPFRSWRQLPNLALLAIKWQREHGRALWHWVVFVRGKERCYVLDSNARLRNHVRTDFGRMRPKWYIPIHGLRTPR